MKRSITLAVAAAALALSGVMAAAAVQSGLKPGATPGAFEVLDVTGPNKGTELCYRCQYGIAPVMAVFVNGDVGKSEKLVADMQKIVDANKSKGLKSFVVFMNGKSSKTEVERLAKSHKTTVPMVVLPRGVKESDIAAYKINSGAKNTVLLWKESVVKANFVDVEAGKTTDVEKAVEAMLQ